MFIIFRTHLRDIGDRRLSAGRVELLVLLELLATGEGGGALHAGIGPTQIPGGGARTRGGSWGTEIQVVGGVAAHTAVAAGRQLRWQQLLHGHLLVLQLLVLLLLQLLLLLLLLVLLAGRTGGSGGLHGQGGGGGHELGVQVGWQLGRGVLQLGEQVARGQRSR